MFRLDIEQNQLVVLALAGGAVLTLAAVLAYIALWRYRPDQHAGEARTLGQKIAWHVPWILIVTYVGIAIYALVYFWQAASTPANW